ncbi:MAG: response regulator, partial [Oscillospiraceae bacterium]|nr:response regulator [Oscillospiraceae bacterium]
MSRKYKALIVEDDRVMASTLNTLLETDDFETDIVGSGVEAQKLISNYPPDIILLDLGLPDMDGMK